MSNIQKISIALTEEQITSLRSAVESGEYATTSEIIREALREWQFKRELRAEDIQRLRQLWDEGKASGPAKSINLPEVRLEARQRLKRAAGQRHP